MPDPGPGHAGRAQSPPPAAPPRGIEVPSPAVPEAAPAAQAHRTLSQPGHVPHPAAGPVQDLSRDTSPASTAPGRETAAPGDGGLPMPFVTPTTPSEGTVARGVVHQVLQAALHVLPKSQDSPEQGTELRLNPEELGRVKLTLRSADGALILHVQVDRPETADLIRRHIGELMQEFRSLGYAEVNVSLGHGSDSARDAWRQSGEAAQSGAGQPADPAATPETDFVDRQLTPRSAGIGGPGTLDLRL